MIREGFFAVPPGLVEGFLAKAGGDSERRRMRITGDGWRSRRTDAAEAPWLDVARALCRAKEPAEWWASVLFPGARVIRHVHRGAWSFVWHLSAGEDLSFPEVEKRFPTVPGQILVFPASLAHETVRAERGPEPRVTIAGNFR